MFTLLWRKMRNTKWMVLCLFIGFLLAAGMMSTIPIYMDASLQRMLIKDMEQYQIDNNKYPGLYSVTKTLQITADTNTQQATIDDVVSKTDSRINAIGIASENSKTTLIDDCLYICLLYTSPSPRDPKTSRMPSSA